MAMDKIRSITRPAGEDLLSGKNGKPVWFDHAAYESRDRCFSTHALVSQLR
jgi:hypothetical protein